MNWLDRLERRFPRFGIANLVTYIVAGRFLALLLSLARPEYPQFLVLDPWAVRRGEVWRLASYLFLPPEISSGFFGGVFGALIQLYFTWLIGRTLENTWGAFRFTLYYAIGGVGTALVAVALGTPATPDYLDLSLFLAFATVFPDFTVLLFFILPVRMKWLGWLSAVGLLWTFTFRSGLSGRIAILVAFSNYLAFFWPVLIGWFATAGRRPVAVRSVHDTGPAPAPAVAAGPVHRCTSCGRTERDDTRLEFRWCKCGRCGEGLEYCMDHLASHQGKPANA